MSPFKALHWSLALGASFAVLQLGLYVLAQSRGWILYEYGTIASLPTDGGYTRAESSEVAAPSPEAMPTREAPAQPDEAMVVGGDVEPPTRLPSSGGSPSLRSFFERGGYMICTCLVRFLVSDNGEPERIEILKPDLDRLPSEVDGEIRRTVASWRFAPATRNGQPVAVWYNVAIYHCPCRPRGR